MTISEIQKLTRPFVPCVIHLADGSHFDVPHTDFLLFLPRDLFGPIFIVVGVQGGIHYVDAGQVTDLEHKEPAAHLDV